MKADKLGPILRPLFKKIKELLKELVQTDAVLSFKKGPEGGVEEIKEVLWNNAFCCKVEVENISEKGLFILIEKTGGIFLSGKLLLLPQSNIDSLVKNGEVNESILDAQKEIFNMLVGNLNDVLSEKVEKNIHLIMSDNFILNEKDLSFLPPEEKYMTYIANVKLAGPITFSMAIIFSNELSSYIIKNISEDEEEQEEEDFLKKEESKEAKEDEISEREESDNLINFHSFQKSNASNIGFNSFLDEIMEEDFPVAQLGTTLWNALNKMKSYNADFIVIVDGLRFVGLLTMADIRRGLSPFLEEPFKEYCREQDLATKNFQVEWFLERDIKPIPYNATLEEVINHYLGQNSPYVPVCKNNRIMGIVTHTRMIAYLANLIYSSNEKENLREEVDEAAS